MDLLHTLLSTIVQAGASDVHLRAGSLPGGRVGGDLQRFGTEKLSEDALQAATRPHEVKIKLMQASFASAQPAAPQVAQANGAAAS